MEGLLIVAGLVVGLLVGFFVARSTSPERGQVKELEAALTQEKESLNNYRDKVSQHFSHTAELVEALAANSREIYSHLALGSQELCGSDVEKLKENDDVFSISENEKAKDEKVILSQLETRATASTPEKDEHELLHSADVLSQAETESTLQEESGSIESPALLKKAVGQPDDSSVKRSSDVCVDIEQHRKKA